MRVFDSGIYQDKYRSSLRIPPDDSSAQWLPEVRPDHAEDRLHSATPFRVEIMLSLGDLP